MINLTFEERVTLAKYEYKKLKKDQLIKINGKLVGYVIMDKDLSQDFMKSI